MKNSIVVVFVSLTAYILMSSAQQPATWTNPYFFYHFNNPLALPTPQKITPSNEMVGNPKVFSGHDDHSIANTLGSHVVMLSTCLRELKTTKADLVQTHTEVENVKKELNEIKGNSQLLPNLLTTVENLKKEINDMIKNSNLHTTQRLDATHAVVESVKKELNELKASAVSTSIGRMPKSCGDLHAIGHRKSGLFSVMGNKTVDNVYCDFTKHTNDADFQKVIGHVAVKTSAVYFHAQRSSDYGNVGTTLPFDLLRVNVGNGMSTSGVFTAPKSGKYYFTYSGISIESKTARVELQIKTETADWTRVTQAYGAIGHQTFSLVSIMELAKGNQIRLLFNEGVVHDHGLHYTNFVGHLLEEDIE